MRKTIFFAITACAAVRLFAAAPGAANLCDFTTERFKYAKLHLQGIDCDESGVYYGFANGVTKTDWQGKVTAQGVSVYGEDGHIGDICVHSGKVYATSWRYKDESKKTREGMIQVFDAATLKPLVDENRAMPYANDGISFCGGGFRIGTPSAFCGGHPHTNLVVASWDESLQTETARQTRYSDGTRILFNVQTLAAMDGMLWHGCYVDENWYRGRKLPIAANKTYLMDDGGKIVCASPVWAATGIAVVPESMSGGRKLLITGRGVEGRYGYVKVRFWEYLDNALVPYIPDGRGGTLGKFVKPKGDDWWRKRRAAKKDEIAALGGKVDFVMVGDSITHGWDNSEALARLREHRTVLALGYNGDTIGNVIWRVLDGELDGYRAKTVAIMIGTNDLPFKNPDDVATLMKSLVSFVRDAQPQAKIVVQSVLPRGVKGEDKLKLWPDRIVRHNERLREIAAAAGAAYLDLTGRFANADGSVRAELFWDGLHPNPRGQAVWAQALECGVAPVEGVRYGNWLNHYSDSCVYKIGLKGKHLKTLYTTMDQAMDIIRRVHDFSGGIHQVVYLCGWQFDGHDSKYPSWSEVGAHVAYGGEATPLLALRRFIRDAREYGADVSLHVNMNDAYTNAPDWQAYVDADAICRRKDGSLQPYQVFDGEQSYQINHEREWKSGLAKKRIDALLEMIPELCESKTIHIDAFFGDASPYHGLDYWADMAYCDKIVDYWREKGLDVTTELLSDVDQIGYFPMVYHYNLDERHRVAVDPRVLCGGDGEWSVRNMNFYSFDDAWKARTPDAGVVYPEAWGEGHFADLRGHHVADAGAFLGKLVRTTMLNAWYNQFRPVRHMVDAGTYRVEWTGGVVSEVRMADRRLAVSQKGRVVVDGGDYLLDYPDGKLVAYSAEGCSRDFALPPLLARETLFRGRRWPSGEEVSFAAKDGKIAVELPKGTSAVVFPASARR